MTKGITGLDRKQLSRLVELVVSDDGIALAPRILDPLQAVRATLMYLRTNTSQEAIADVMGVSQPTISRAIAVVTRIIARVLGPLLATAEQVPRTGLYIIDGTLLPCWSWKSEPCLWSGKHKRTGMNLQVLVSLTGHLLWACDPLPGSVHDAKATRLLRHPGRNQPSRCIADKGYIGTGTTTPYKKTPKANSPKPRNRPTQPWARSDTSSNGRSHT